MREGNIISFKVFIDAKGRLMTEYSKLPSSKVTKVFDEYDKPFIDKILKELEPKLENLHNQLELELERLT
tara:strand:+ start:2491 stop:2700 length:210 start_codon:yes stop_codon:yes gene_type:complete